MTDSITSDRVTSFVERHPDAAMITLRADGSAHMARVELGVVDGQIRTAGSPALVRTRNLRRDPRCSLFVFTAHPWWLGLETVVHIIEGPMAPGELMSLLRARHPGTPRGMVTAHDDALEGDRLYSESEYVEHARQHELMVFEFRVVRAYGNTGMTG